MIDPSQGIRKAGGGGGGDRIKAVRNRVYLKAAGDDNFGKLEDLSKKATKNELQVVLNA